MGKFCRDYEESTNDSRLVYISYFDHLLFKNMNANLCKPSIRETIGWIVKENPVAIWLQWDRNIKNDSENDNDDDSGLVILKDCIINRFLISPFETTREGLCRSLAQPSSTKNLKTKKVEHDGNR
jgi:hypothetical protein